jgi:hypothetical protein
MKTSKKILIASFSIIALFHISLIFEVDKPDFYEIHAPKEFTPDPFSHLMITNNAALVIKKDTTQNLLQYHYLKDTKPDTSFFFVKNDTLFVTNPDLKGRRKAINLKYKKLNSITAVDSYLELLGNYDMNIAIKNIDSKIRIPDKDSQ